MKNKFSLKILFISCGLLTFLFITCNDSDDRDGIGPCVHTYEEPIFNITSVTDMDSGKMMDLLIIKEITCNNSRRNLSEIKIKSYNVVFSDSVLLCNLPCGFGIKEGNYILKVSASGYRDTVIHANAKYSIFKGGCPSSNSGGTRTSFKMKKSI